VLKLVLPPPLASAREPVAVLELLSPLATASRPIAMLALKVPLALADRPQAVLIELPPSSSTAVDFGEDCGLGADAFSYSPRWPIDP
jgi:hypothetical protein